ncbi:Vacuolar inheritance and morphology protein [Coemansia sp. RSA 2708]|nr:Vacuolar inheritance and morphology protein [Coemansia sp. RSA 2708]
MGEEDGQQHKTMIKQLTDLDDHELDEQAGLFMHPRRKSLRTETTPRPLSQPFFQPLQVFPDVLSVSAMVERQGQREEPGAAPAPASAAVDRPAGGAGPALSSGTTTPASALAQYPQGLALLSQAADAGDARGKPALRSVSLTRIANEASDVVSSRPGSSDATSGEPSRRAGARGSGMVTASPLEEASIPHALRSRTPAETPTEEGDRQLSVETSRPSRAGGGRRGGKRAGTGDARGVRLFARRANASSRGSEEENSDGDEQFIYRNSRSSLHVSSIPEESYDDRGGEHGGKRRPHRHRLSTYLGGERRDSGGRAGGSGASGGSYTNAGARPGRRAAPRGVRGGGSVNTGAYFHTSISHGGAQHRSSILTQPNDYGLSSEESDAGGEAAGLRSTHVYSRRNSRRPQASAYYGSSEDLPETTPLFRRHVARRKRTGAVAQLARGLGASALALALLLALLVLFNLTSAPLADVEATKVTNILATEKELLFILHVQATNPNVREVLVERAEIGVFAAAAVANSSSSAANDTGPAILLGNVYELSDPMRFAPGSLRAPATGAGTTQISIHHPGGIDDDGSDSPKWRRLLNGPYDLTIRGTLQYTLWQRNYAARICIAKLANLPPDSNATAAHFFSAAGMGCDDDDWDEPITLPVPPAPPA